MLDIVIASRNLHKVRELRGLLRVRGIRWRSLANFPSVPDVAEHGRTFLANARHKALTVARATGCLALADDSGLAVETLKGAPGVRSARFAGRHGDDVANNRKLLRVLAAHPRSHRRARYSCVLALAVPARVVAVATGDWRGRIAKTPAGRGGFGYDPLFWVPHLRRTVGQLPPRVKARHSHRAAAARRLLPALRRLSAACRIARLR